MGLQVTSEASGPVPPLVAWERYEQLDQWVAWSPQLRSVTTSSGERHLRAGLKGRVHGPAHTWADFTVLSVDAHARQWSWQVRRGPVSVHLDHGVDERFPDMSDGGSRTWLTLRGPAPVVLGYAPVAWFALHRLVTLRE